MSADAGVDIAASTADSAVEANADKPADSNPTDIRTDTRAGVGADIHADAGPRLRKLFPALFGHPAKPLKLQIQNDIQAQAPGVFSKKALSAFFRRYTGSHAYLNAVAHAKSRFDLDGRPAGELSAEHRTAAVQELARRRDNQQARIELEEQQRRNRATLLRDFQSTTLTPANFCALKSVAVDELDGLLSIAKAEADERNRQARLPNANAPRDARRAQPGAPSPEGPRRDARDRGERGAPSRRDPTRPAADARRR